MFKTLSQVGRDFWLKYSHLVFLKNDFYWTEKSKLQICVCFWLRPFEIGMTDYGTSWHSLLQSMLYLGRAVASKVRVRLQSSDISKHSSVWTIEKRKIKKKNPYRVRHSLVDSSALSILLPGFESQAHHLRFFQFIVQIVYFLFENNENIQKEGRIGPFKKKKKKPWMGPFK